MACPSPPADGPSDFRVVEPAPDRAGGARMTDLTGRRVRVESVGLRALDLLDAPRLEHLDLTGCRPGLFLALARCPHLQRIDLPPGAQGAILHWDRHGDNSAEVLIHGPVEHLDLCGHGYAFGLPNGPAGVWPWQGVRITCSPERWSAADEEALVWLGTEASSTVSVLTVPQQARSVAIHGVGVGAVEVGEQAALAYLALAQAPDLRSVSSAAPLLGLWLERLGHLERVQASGKALQLKYCGDLAAGVQLEGAWSDALMVDTAVAENAQPRLGRVTVRGGERAMGRAPAKRARAWLPENRRAPLQPSEVPPLLEAAQAGEARAGATLIRWAEGVPRRNALFALQTLYGLLERPDAEHERIWQARNTLARRFRSRRPRMPEWTWNLPQDLAEETLRMDFRIFARCRGQAAGTQRLDVHLRNAPGSREMRVLASVAADRRVPIEERTLAGELLREVLGVAAGGLVKTPHGPGHLGPPSDLGPLVRWIIEQADRGMADDLLAWIERVVPPLKRVRYLAELATHGHAGSRAAAMALALDPSPGQRHHQEQAQHLRQRAMAAALAPARSDRLADPHTDRKEGAS